MNRTYNMPGQSTSPDLFGRPRRATFALALAAATLAMQGVEALTHTRASVASQFNVEGAIVQVAADVPRYDFHPVTHEPRGLLIERAATNLYLNSAVAVTQTVATTAQVYTLSFYGTGTITLSTAHSHAVVGAGAFPARVTYTFTSTAANLVMTLTGSATNVQLETGSVATSWIPTAGVAATRAADIVTIQGADFDRFYSGQPEWCAVLDVELMKTQEATGATMFFMQAADAQSYFSLSQDSSGNLLYDNYRDGPGVSYAEPLGSYPGSVALTAGVHKYAFRGTSRPSGLAAIDGVVDPSTQQAVYVYDSIRFGYLTQNTCLWLRGFDFYPEAMTNDELAALTA